MDSYERALAQLKGLIAPRGIARLERALGWPSNNFHKAQLRKTGLRLREVTDILDSLQESLVLGPSDGRRSAAARFMAQGADLARKLSLLLPPLREEWIPDRSSQQELDALDELRLHEPAKAAQMARSMALQAAREGRAGDAARLLAREAAALRLNLETQRAHVCLWWSLRHLPDEPDLWLRASHIPYDYGDFPGAWELAGLALSGFARQGDLGGMGRCISDQARYFYYMDEFDKALQGFESALKILPAELKRQRSMTHQNLGMTLAAMGRLQEAASHAAQAAEIETPPGIHGGWLFWLQARIARRLQNHSEAETLYRQTIERLEPSLGNAALATCELVQFLLEEERFVEAVTLAKATARYIHPSGNRVVNAALLELARAAVEGEGHLTVALTQKTITRIQNALQKRRRTKA